MREKHTLRAFLSRLLLQACLSLVVGQACAQPTASERLPVEGLREPVEVVRDSAGVNHVYARNTHDLFFAQGYLAARDRLFQFELWRRQATGTVAEILGASELRRDIGARLFRFRGDMDREMDHYHPEGRLIIRAYTDGVNAWVDAANRQPQLLPFEFALLGIRPGRWTPEVVVSRHQGLLGNVEDELRTGRAVARAGEEAVRRLSNFHPRQPDLRLDSTITPEMLEQDILGLYQAYRRPVDFGRSANATAAISREGHVAPMEEGSNNWVVSGSRTASGLPILANDPHRTIALPSLRYIVHLVAPGWNVLGGGEPVIPGVSIGHNEYGAWGLTIFQTDGEDLYVYRLNPSNRRQYLHKGRWVDMRSYRERIPVKDADSVTAELLYTVHGPVTFVDTVRNVAFAVRCAWLEPGGAPYLASLRMNQATDWGSFREACRYSHIPGENMVWADRKGNIGWQVVGITPLRDGFSGMVPLPGDGRFEWSGYIDILERPHALNPARGFLATANQHVTPSDYTHWNAIGYEWADPFRGRRIEEVLSASAGISTATTAALQTDYFSLPARRLVPLLRASTPGTDAERTAAELLKRWDLRLTPGSAAAGIYTLWERRILSVAAERFVPLRLKGLVNLQLSKVLSWMEEPGTLFGADALAARDRFIASTFSQAVEEALRRFGSDTSGWVLGQPSFKHTSFPHPLHARLSAEERARYSPGPMPRGGNAHTPNSTSGQDRQSTGASFRLIADLSDWDRSLMINAPGQSGDPRSPFYANLYGLWNGDGYFPARYSRGKVEEGAFSRTLLLPR